MTVMMAILEFWSTQEQTICKGLSREHSSQACFQMVQAFPRIISAIGSNVSHKEVKWLKNLRGNFDQGQLKSLEMKLNINYKDRKERTCNMHETFTESGDYFFLHGIKIYMYEINKLCRNKSTYNVLNFSLWYYTRAKVEHSQRMTTD